MLLASWHTLRSSRPLINRTFVAYSHHQSLALNPSDHLQNLRASHRHNYSVDSGPTNNASTTFPIDVLDAQASFRAFCALIEEDKLEEARIAMRDAVEAAPTPAVMSQFKQVLLDTPEKTASLMLDLASVFVSKGEHQMVKDHLLPILQKVAGQDELERLGALLAAPSVSHQAETSESVFEDMSVDYSTARLATALPKPSILDMVQNKLPALLPEVPVDDSSIFEEEDQGYTFTVPTDIAAPLSSSHFLLQLIEQNQFDNAYQLLREMQELGTSISKSPAYEKPVLALISGSDLPAKERRMRFLAWLPLLPDKPLHNADSSFKIRAIAKKINGTKTTNLEILTDFALSMAGKGYATTMSYDIIPTIIRYSNLQFLRQFLADLCEASRQYNCASSPHSTNGINSHIYSTAVRTLARGRRCQDAVALFTEATRASICITKPTFDILISQLRQSNQTKLISEVEGIVASSRLSVTRPSVLDHLPKTARKSLKSLTSHLPSDLRLLKRGVVLKTLPEPKAISNFMNDYVSTGRTVGLTMLLQKALNHSFFSSNVLLLSEMMLYYNTKHYDLLLETFVDHFHLTGIPREEVLALHRRILEERAKHVPSPSSPSPHCRIVSSSQIDHPRGKLWPTIDHCDLVWTALASYAESDNKLEKLYMKLIHYGREGVDGLDNPNTPSTASLMAPRPHGKNNTNVSSVAFTPFIRPMMRAFGEERGLRILNDMHRLNVSPTVYHYTELAAFYSCQGMAEKAFLVLDYMEQQHAHIEEKPTSAQGTLSSPATTSIYTLLANRAGSIPKPDLVTYVSMIRGFILCRHVEAATEVLRRLCQVHEYVPCDDSYLDTTLVHLHELKTQGAAWIPKRY